jgi:hypothetical protein
MQHLNLADPNDRVDVSVSTTPKLPEAEEARRQARTDRAFCLCFPNSVARDARLSGAGLVTAAFRATFADDRSGYGLNEKAIRGIVRGKGFGRNMTFTTKG